MSRRRALLRAGWEFVQTWACAYAAVLVLREILRGRAVR